MIRCHPNAVPFGLIYSRRFISARTLNPRTLSLSPEPLQSAMECYDMMFVPLIISTLSKVANSGIPWNWLLVVSRAVGYQLMLFPND